MKFKKYTLENRILTTFIIFSILLTAVLLLASSQLTKWQIRQYERNNGNQTYHRITTAINKDIGSQLKKLNEFKEIYSTTGNQSLKKQLFNKVISDSVKNKESGTLIVYDEGNTLFAGERWEVTDSISVILSGDLILRDVGDFKVYFDRQIYLVTFLRDIGRTFVLYKMMSEVYFRNAIDNNLYLMDYPIQKYQTSDFTFLKDRRKEFVEVVTQNYNERRFNFQESLGHEYGMIVYWLEDFQNINRKFILIPFRRTVNIFFNQSFMIIYLILFSFSLFIVVVFSNWVSQNLLKPLHRVSLSMINIMNNPLTKPEETEFQDGVVGDLRRTFYQMQLSLYNYFEANKIYKTISTNIATAIFWLDENFIIEHANPMFFEMFQINESNINFADLIDLRNEELEHLKNGKLTLSTKEVVWGVSRKYYALTVNTVEYNDNRKYAGSVIDITSEIQGKQALEALQLGLIRSNKLEAIGSKIDGLIHNMNSQLNTILGFSLLMERDIGDNRDLQRIISAGKNLTQFVKDLQHKYRSDNIAMRRPININEIIENELNLCIHNLFCKHHVEMTRDLDYDLPDYYGIYGEISQCFANVLTNAIESLRDAPVKQIHINTYSENGFYCIQVTDTGCGIAAVNKRKIFDPGFTTNSEHEGFGIGLAVTKMIIEKYRGVIEFDSRENKGSEFVLKFKMESEPQD